jgi:hypothetical protein
MEKYCQACGMPLIKKEDFANGDENALFCAYCVNEDGSVKSCEDIFEGGVQYFMTQIDNDRALAERLTRKNMGALPYWKDKQCEVLQGEMATDEEFATVLEKLSNK